MPQMLTDDQIRAHLDCQQAMEAKRAPWESIWRDVDTWVDPELAGGFTGITPYGQRDAHIFDSTAPEGLDRFGAAIKGLTMPSGTRWHGAVTTDPELNKLPSVQRWCEAATDRLFACRQNVESFFETQTDIDVRQLGKYGTAPLWIGEVPGSRLFYKSIHLSEVYIDENAYGFVDRAHRKFKLRAWQAVQMFSQPGDTLPAKILECMTADNGKKSNDEFEFVHVICPNADYDRAAIGHAGQRFDSITIAIDARQQVRRSGFRTMPMPVLRNVVSPGSIYGRSPAMKVLGNIKTLNSMGMTGLRAAHKQVDPALAFYDDGDITRLSTKPGGLNPGLVDEFGRLLVQAIPHGGNLTEFGAFQEAERQPVKDAFLEQIFQLLTDPSDRMTATQVLETARREGILISPFVSRAESEKLGPMIVRELELLQVAGQLPERPPEMIEAGAGVRTIYDNPANRMKRAEEAAGFTRWVEIGMQIASATGDPSVFDFMDADAAMPGVAEVLGVRPSWIATPDQVQAKRQSRAEQKAVEQATAAAPQFADAALSAAKANQISAAA